MLARIVRSVRLLNVLCSRHRSLALENVALRQQRAMYRRTRPKPAIRWCGRNSSWSHAQGVPGKVVARLMGHAKIDATLNVYTQVFNASVRPAADRVGAELFTTIHSLAGGIP